MLIKCILYKGLFYYDLKLTWSERLLSLHTFKLIGMCEPGMAFHVENLIRYILHTFRVLIATFLTHSSFSVCTKCEIELIFLSILAQNVMGCNMAFSRNRIKWQIWWVLLGCTAPYSGLCMVHFCVIHNFSHSKYNTY